MKKILVIFLMFVPFIVNADTGLDLRNQMLDNQIETLTKERDSKYEKLQKCEKTTQGFKIAGLTTLVATGFGIYGNIKLSQKLKGKNVEINNNSARVVINKTKEEKLNDNCELLCGIGNAPSGCSC